VPRQLRLDLNRQPLYGRADFVVSHANGEAVRALDIWRMWPQGALALVGPEGVGKTHLLRIWAEETGAAILDRPPKNFAALEGRPLAIDDADRFADAEALFHLFNIAAAGGALLMTARQPPRAWPFSLPDLKSRLGAVQTIEVAAPDDEALAGMLRNLFRERNIVPAEDLIPYLLTRTERSFAAASAVVAQLDEAALDRGREVNRALASQVLEIDNVINDLLG
jgi:chromosomal replication initiation ATPase DnaA